MKTHDRIVYFKSKSPLYEHEESGKKSNIVRILTEPERNILTWTQIDKIEIENSRTGETFTRVLTDISLIGILSGSYIAVLSWNSEEGKEAEK